MSKKVENFKEITIPNQVASVMQILEKEKYVVYVVGGMIRDQCLGFQSQDWDLATSALPQTLIQLFPDAKLVGIAYGTITLIKDDIEIQITTFRTEGIYLNHRKPKYVTFVDNIQTDLSRRDFTINAIAYHPKIGWIDPYHGKSDIEGGIISCVGNPKQRFREDAIRMIRAIRFAVKYDFKIAYNTWNAILENANLIAQIAPMRLHKELKEILCSENINRAFVLLSTSGIWKALFPNSQSELPLAVDETLLKKINFQNKRERIEFMLLCIIEQESISKERIRSICQMYGWDKKIREDIITVIHYTKSNNQNSTLEMMVEANLSLKQAFPLYIDWFMYHHENKIEQIKKWYYEIQIKNNTPMMITGEMLRNIGITKGEEIGFILTQLKKEWLLGKIDNNTNALIQRANEFKNNNK